MIATDERIVWAVALTAIIVVALGIGLYPTGMTFFHQQTSNGGITKFDNSPVTAEITNHTSGLELRLMINTSFLDPGRGISVNITEFDTLATTVNLSRFYHGSHVSNTRLGSWPVAGLGLGVCYVEGMSNFPMGLGVVRGYYDSSNVSSIAPGDLLALHQPYYGQQYGCNLLSFTYFSFQPQSDVFFFNACTPISSCSNRAYWNDSFRGSWVPANGTGNATMFQSLTPGVYTVIGGDQWGDVVTLHFVVGSAVTNVA